MTLDEAAQPGRPADEDDTFGVSAQRVEDRVVLEMTGELDISGTELALSAARSALEAQPLPTTLQVDGGGLEFVDSSGIAALLRIRDLAAAANVPFVVTEASVSFRRVIELAGLEGTFFPPA